MNWPLAAVICMFIVGATACFLFGKTEGGMGLASLGACALLLGMSHAWK